jgi:hypothetical protein
MKTIVFFVFCTFIHSAFSLTQDGPEKNLVLENIFSQIKLEMTSPEVQQNSLPSNSLPTQPTSKSVGDTKVEAQKAKIRQQIAAQKGLPTSTATGDAPSSEQMLKQQLAANRELIKSNTLNQKNSEPSDPTVTTHPNSPRDWQNDYLKKMQSLTTKTNQQNKAWNNQVNQTLGEWKKAQEKFLGKIEIYKENLIEIPDVDPVPIELMELPMANQSQFESYTVKEAFSMPIGDQENRPTCSSFAGVRALEILAAQKNKKLKLSEQYFYWASKPDCQEKPCDVKGSFVGHGFDVSQKSNRLDIPLLQDCPYATHKVPGNQTHIPLAKGCGNGVLQVSDFKYVKTLDEVLDSLEKDLPVIAGVKLKPNFYLNSGLILAQKQMSPQHLMDEHALGHAILFIGYIKLPANLFAQEGRFCFLTANSWGLGWGQGGYACLTEKWLLENRSKNPFVVPLNVKI